MSYQKINIPAFKGLNSQAAPELIEDGEARDILNFRMEKVGKLVNRNGYICGLFATPGYGSFVHGNEPQSANVWTIQEPPPVPCYTSTRGIIAIGEMGLAEKWDEIDTDRLMVYVVRTGDIGSFTSDHLEGRSPKTHRVCYLFSPMTGKYTNILLTTESSTTNDKSPVELKYHNTRDTKAQTLQGEGSETSLYAPNKDLKCVDNIDGVATKEDSYIDHYIDLEQYRHKLIVSDRINGDMIIEDEYDREESDQCDDAEHDIHFRANCLDEFDIDILRIDSRLQSGEENDATAGVINGMGLYGYELDKSVKVVSEDHFDGQLSDIGWYGTDIDTNENAGIAAAKAYNKLRLNEPDTMITMANSSVGLYQHHGPNKNRSMYITYTYLNSNKNYTFTNADGSFEYDDIDKPIVFPQEEYENSEGVLIKEKYSDIYVWDDLELNYFPSSGIAERNHKFMCDADRIFRKAYQGVRLTSLTAHTGNGQKVPVGGWKYRFVWDYGDGVYSAPSAEIVAPDMLWSAAKDSEVKNAAGSYERYIDLNEDYENQFTDQQAPYDYIGAPSVIAAPDMFDANGDLTRFGELMFDLKYKLYSDVNHKYGTKSWLSVADVNSATWKQRGDFTTLITAFFSKSDVKLSGFVWEAAAFFREEDLGGWQDKTSRVRTKFGGIVIPCFQTIDESYTYNSIFDDDGRYRLSYINTSDPYRQLVFPHLALCVMDTGSAKTATLVDGKTLLGANEGRRVESFMTMAGDIFISGKSSLAINTALDDMGAYAPTREDLYFNIVSVTDDANNNPDGTYSGGDLSDLRPNTTLRGISKEEDYLGRVNPSIESQAVDRLVLNGEIGLELCSFGDDVYYARQAIANESRPSPNNLRYTDTRLSGKLYWRDGGHISMDPENPVLSTNTPSYVSDVVGSNRLVIYPETDNLRLIMYGQADRFIGIEQLTSYFPSSLLFGYPRLALRIQASDVPKRAKRLMIFRTKSSLQNDYQPTQYGLVETIEIGRDSNNNPVSKIEVRGSETTYQGIYYFDETKDKLLDFSLSPSEYEGLRNPLYSRFNIALNERVYYLNFTERYQPIPPRTMRDQDAESWDPYWLQYMDSDVPIYELSNGQSYSAEPNTNFYTFDSVDGEGGFPSDTYVRYKYIYRDLSGVKSKSITSPIIPVNNTGPLNLSNRTVVLFFMPAKFDDYIDDLRIYRADSTNRDSLINPTYYYIGSVRPEDGGIFVDDNKTSKITEEWGCDDPSIIHYESGVRWSEPHRPDWIKLENFQEFKTGDGDQITGVSSLTGNLFITKERSSHRVAVQAKGIPTSRTDEVSPLHGCIAPNTLIHVNNTVFYLSWDGFVFFDNNTVQKADGKFAEELQFSMAAAGENIRDASCGYNPHYDEIYLNIPMLTTLDRDDGRQDNYGHGYMGDDDDNSAEADTFFRRELLGHLYVISLSKGYVTKYAYQTLPLFNSTTQSPPGDPDSPWYKRETVDPLQMIRLYHTNSLGEMRSGDILPSRWAAKINSNINTSPYIWSGIWIETPYNANFGYGTPVVGSTDWHYPRQQAIGRGVLDIDTRKHQYLDTDDIFQGLAWSGRFVTNNIFPPLLTHPVYVKYRSKFFTGSDESLIKRIRKFTFNLFTKGYLAVTSRSIFRHAEAVRGTNDGSLADDRIENQTSPGDAAVQTFNFNPSIDSTSDVGWLMQGTGSNNLSIVPATPFDSSLDMEHDYTAKAVRYAVDFDTYSRTQLNQMSIYWRPIHSYLI